MYLCEFTVSNPIRYFETFDVVSEIHSRDRLELLQLTSQCSTREELGKNLQEVNYACKKLLCTCWLLHTSRAATLLHR